MKRVLALPTGFASRICAPCSVLLMLTSAAALAQSTTDAANPPPAPVQSSAHDDASSGCEPIGLTASGEVVFPFRCKGVIELQRAAATRPAEPKPAVADAAPAAIPEQPQAQPAAAAKTVAVQPAAKPATAAIDAAHTPKTVAAKTLEAKTVEAKTVEAKSVDAKTREGKTVEIPRGVLPAAGAARDRTMGPSGCSRFRSYDAGAATYLAFDGKRRPCHEVAVQPARSRVAGNQPAPKQAAHTASPAGVKH